MPVKTIRTFFAIKIPLHSSIEVEKILLDLKEQIPRKVKWVAAGSMHVTLKFIGDFKETHIEPIRKDLFLITRGTGKMEIAFTELGGFPNLNKPRVIWVGLNYPERLHELAIAIDLLGSKYGYNKETRSFSPHVTLGRVRRDTKNYERERIGNIIKEYEQIGIAPFTCAKLFFIKSALTPTGPVYNTLAEIVL